MMGRLVVLMLCGVLWGVGGWAQPEVELITIDNLSRLEVVGQFDFTELPAGAGEIINGRVYINETGRLLVVVNRHSQVIMLDDSFSVQAISAPIMTSDNFPATFIDGRFEDGADGRFAALHVAGDGYILTVMDASGLLQQQRYTTEGQPASVWLADDSLWVEVMPLTADVPYILRHDLPLGGSQAVRLPYAPAAVADTVVRIGRLHPPLAVTVTADSLVQRWDLQSGRLTATVAVDELPIYGYVTPDNEKLVWRDAASLALNVLDFSAQVSQQVVTLDNQYTPFVFLTADADVILGVDLNDEPLVVAWPVATGEMQVLGTYRACGRALDMARLSLDGTTLVIGCDAGLQIWRVSSAED